MSPDPQRRWTPEQYLAFDRESEIRHEYFDGELFAMSGASREHNLIATNIVGTLHPQLKGRGCEMYANDMRVRIPSTDLYTYPDVVVVCGEPEFDDEEGDVLLNPTMIVEVLSPSTEDYDHGRKFAHYRTLSSFRVYLMVAQDRVRAELFTRQDDGRWILWETDNPEDVLELSAVGARLPLGDVYDEVPGIG